MVFPVVMYGCESWTIKQAEHQISDAFELWCWRRLLRVPWTARRSNHNFKALVTIHSDFGAWENKICYRFYFFPIYLPQSDGTGCRDLQFLNVKSFKPALSLFSFTFKRLFSYSLPSANIVASSAYLRLTVLPAILIQTVLHPTRHFTCCTLYRS